jgi:hypothetical protein
MNTIHPMMLEQDAGPQTGAMIPRLGKGVRMSVSRFGVGYSVPTAAQSFNHPWKPALSAGGVTLQRGTVALAAGIFEPVINGVPISGPAPSPQPALYLDPAIAAGGTTSYVCLQLRLTPPASGLPTALAKDQIPEIVHVANPISIEATLALCALVLITWQAGQPFAAFEGVYFNVTYTRIIPGPGGGAVQHFFT